MVSSLLARVGTPRSFTVVSDGSITPTTAAAVRRLSPVIDITESSELLESSWVPESVRRFAHSHVLGIKLAIMMRPVDGAACLFVDTDVEFHAGGRRLLGYLGDLEQGPRFMEHPEWIDGVGVPNTYDPRLLEGRDVLPRVNSGVVIWSRALEWSDALERIEPIADQALALSEQTAVALALSDSGARVLPAQEFVLVADDGGSPFDRHTGERTILRHYFSIGLQWKMNLKGGPSGMRSAPAAVLTALARSLRDQSREGARSRS